MQHFEDLNPWFPKPEASAAIDVAARVRDRVVVIVPGGGIGPECLFVGCRSNHPVALNFGFEQDAIRARRTVIIHGEGGIDGTEEVHVEVVIADARRHKVSKVFAMAYPGRFLQMGIAEQNFVGVAVGLASLGFVPWLSSFTVFFTHRAIDPIRMLVAQTHANVRLVRRMPD